MADNILSDFGINILEEEIDDVIFQTNEFLTDATFTGSQGPFWWLAHFCTFLHLQLFANQQLAKFCSARQIPNGTKSQENKIKNASSPTSLVVDFSFLCKGTILSREKQAKSSKYAAYQTFILHVHFQEDTASASCTDLCCLLQRPVKIRFMPFVHYGIAADAHCLGTVYNPSAIICNAEICVPSANW